MTATATAAGVLSATVSAGELLAAVRFAGQGVMSRPPVPLLACVSLSGDADSVTVDGFDYATHARQSVPASGATGFGLVEHARLVKVLAGMSAQSMVTLSGAAGGKLAVSDGVTTFMLPLHDAEAWPAMPMPPTDRVAGLPGAALAEGATRVLVASSRDKTLPLLASLVVDATGPTVELLATDRYRLHVWDTGCAAPRGGGVHVIPRDTMVSLVKAFKASPGVTVTADRERVSFTDGDRTVTTLTVVGEYPKVRRLFPDDTTSHAAVDADKLTAAVKRVGPALERNMAVKLTGGGTDLVVSAGDDVVAETTVSAELAGFERAAFNPQFLTDALGVFKGHTVHVDGAHPHKPWLFTSPDVPGHRHLLVPFRNVS